MAFKFAIAVHFEATCWNPQPSPKYRNSEIIEFPAVLINLETGEIESEFHKFVKPVEKPILSPYCINLTGITQQVVDNGISMQAALNMFHDWLRKELNARNLQLPKMTEDNKTGSCAFITWVDWDFGMCLAKECQRKKLNKPSYFNQWINIRHLYCLFYKCYPKNFGIALSNVGLSLSCKKSGLDDARNLAKVAYKMVLAGVQLNISKDLTPSQLNTDYNF